METRDPRAARSRAALIAAMTGLLDEHELEQITITQLVAAAGVTRPTFYQHYGELAELASDAAIARLDAEFARNEPAPLTQASGGGWLAVAEPVVRRLLEHLAEHRDFYRRVLNGPGTRTATDAAVELVVQRIMERSPFGALVAEPRSEETRDAVVIVSGGIVWLLSTWLTTELTGRDTVAAMAHRISVQLVRLASAG